MLVYQPHLDPDYAVFRTLLFLSFDEHRKHTLEAFRIIDFFFLFPYMLSEMKITAELRAYKNKYATEKSSYTYNGDKKMLFDQLHTIQNCAYESLYAKNILDADLFKDRKIKLNRNVHLPEDYRLYLLSQVKAYHNQLDFLVNKLSRIELLGKDGLKDRTGLMESRYDVAPNVNH